MMSWFSRAYKTCITPWHDRPAFQPALLCCRLHEKQKQKRTSMFLLPRPRRDLPFVLAPMQRRLSPRERDGAAAASAPRSTALQQRAVQSVYRHDRASSLGGVAAHAMRIEEDVKLDYKAPRTSPLPTTLLLRPRSTCAAASPSSTKRSWEGVPLIVANMDTVGTFDMALALARHGAMVAVHKHYSVEEWAAFVAAHPEAAAHVAVSSGVSTADLQKLDQILERCPAGQSAAHKARPSATPQTRPRHTSLQAVQTICLDVANGYSEGFVSCVQRVRAAHPSRTIIAGNVVTNEMTEELIMHGADVVKVGIGPGSVCTTRRQTGLSAVVECADAAHGLGGHIVADGGITNPGDAAKAFGGGADFVMMGGMFAGTDESHGTLVERGGKQYKQFYGMSSSTAMAKHSGGVAEYRSSEGKTVEVAYRGPVDAVILDLFGGLRSACTYIGETPTDMTLH
ncbi:guanosine monophosphate reductase [Emiliania huxleyi CCMP1516]|uniref:GMP reductase n=2 Tax=Emiliania huxleyi TaxID=2903 RepID=A0A0D3KVD9_EMIH1|nr:guanosine monophosphate reductase [Emiliania huxleyi CCMP1516]EOD39724.1 guanosine monophosphate reductase [Emiliania huxleyi CCMP1516]|eukprot:XP_005792153.1 guanosine monophosphate reductase [Emiliania huxleyi CCMP1516]